MAAVSGTLLVGFVVFGIVVPLNAMGTTPPPSNWTMSSPANCPHNDSETHLCSFMDEYWEICASIICCDALREDDEAGEAANAGHVSDETGGAMCEDFCLVMRNCSRYECVTDCCEGYQRDMWHRCQEKGKELVCKNGATKVKSYYGEYCDCPMGFVGETCDTPICHCKNNGNCTVKYGEPVCECPKGYSGKKCEEHECGITCYNGGKCVSDGERAFCNCSAPYVGQWCENKHVQSDKCPHVSSHYPAEDCVTYCHSDSGCYGDMLCCQDGCSRMCKRTTCSKDGKKFAVGAVYRPNPCETCNCTDRGTFLCMTYACAMVECMEGSELVTKPGECCPTCTAPATEPPMVKPPLIMCPKYPVTIELPPRDGAVYLTMNNTNVWAYDYMRRRLKVEFMPQYLKHCRCLGSRMDIQTIEAVTRDSSGAVAKCMLDVYLKDSRPPVFTSCPENVYVLEGKTVHWEEPGYYDNVGIAKKSCTRGLKGQRLAARNYSVEYRVTDYDENVAICRFIVVVYKDGTPFAELPEGLRERTKDKETFNVGLVVGPIMGAIGIFALVVAVCLWMRMRRNRPLAEAQRPVPPIPRQYYDNHVYHLPTDTKLKPPPYSLPSNPPAYSSTVDLKEGEYADIAPPVYTETDTKSESYTNPQYETLRTNSEI